MSNIGPIAGLELRTQVKENCWQWVHKNFHKLSESNKIKIVLAICTKDMPTTIDGNLELHLSEELSEARSRLNSYVRIPIQS